MKKLLLVFLLAVSAVNAPAREPAVIRTVKSDRLRASGHEGPYRFDEAKPLTPAPSGYKAFYISHYGRHGSRYAWDPATYKVVTEVLEKAHANNALTSRGNRLYEEYMAFIPGPAEDVGQLSDLGWEQLGRLGKMMYDSFPEVFGGAGNVLARSSTSQRVILSMTSFCLALQKCNPQLNIECRALQSEINVTKAYSEVVTPWMAQELEVQNGLESADELYERLVPTDAVLELLFTDRACFADRAQQSFFTISLYDIWSGYHNYSDATFLEDLFTPDQIAAMWEFRNYSDWASTVADYSCDMAKLLEDVQTRADAAIAGTGNAADLRFGHDYILNGFTRYININGKDFTPAYASDVKNGFRDYDIPMASNIQFVLYRSESNPSDVLFKLLLNSNEATLPQLKAVDGPYYRWVDFESWAEEMGKPAVINTSAFPKPDFGGQTAIVAHRGFWKCDAAGFSENSIASLKAAQREGFWGSEFDVQMTSDGVVIVNHNDNIEGLRIAEHKWEELKGFLLPNGERRPTLDEYIVQGRKSAKTMLVLEFKEQPTEEKEDLMVEKTFALLKANGMFKPNRVAFISFSRHICEKIAAEAPSFINQYLNGELSPERLAALGINGWDYEERIVARRPKWITDAHELGMSTNVWTVNKEAEMEKFSSDGIDAITTNYPLVAREVLGGKEYRK